MVHLRDPRQVYRVAQQVRLHQLLGEYHRLHSHRKLLHRPGESQNVCRFFMFTIFSPKDPEEVRVPPGERGHHGVLLHHPHHAAVQAHQALVRLEDPHPDVPRFRQGANSAGVFSRSGHRDLRQPGVLRRTDPNESRQRLQEHPAGAVVGAGDDDHGGVRRHGSQNLHRDVRGSAVRLGRRLDDSVASARHSIEFCHVLQPHAGEQVTITLF